MSAGRMTALVMSFVAWLVPVQSAAAAFNVTDERTGQTFDAIVNQSAPYLCGAPCALTFSPVRRCSSTSSFTWSILDGSGRQLVFRWDSTPWHYDFASLGAYTVREGENDGSCGTGSTFQLQVVDRTAPESTITSRPAHVTHDPAPTFRFTASEAGSRFECRLGFAEFRPCETPFIAPPLADGGYTFAVRATDPAGNTDSTPAMATFRIRGPALQARWAHAGNTTSVQRLEIRHVAADARATVRCRHGCRVTSRRFAPRHGSVTLTSAFAGVRLRPRTVIQIAIGAPGAGSRVFRLTVRRSPWDPRRELLCQPAGATKPSTCPMP